MNLNVDYHTQKNGVVFINSSIYKCEFLSIKLHNDDHETTQNVSKLHLVLFLLCSVVRVMREGP